MEIIERGGDRKCIQTTKLGEAKRGAFKRYKLDNTKIKKINARNTTTTVSRSVSMCGGGEESKRKEMASDNGSKRDGENEELCRKPIPGRNKDLGMDEIDGILARRPPCTAESEDLDRERCIMYTGLNKIITGGGGVLAGASHLLENWEPVRIGGKRNRRDECNSVECSPQDLQACGHKNLESYVLVQGNEGSNNTWSERRTNQARRRGEDEEYPTFAKHPAALCKEDRGSGILGSSSPRRADSSDNTPHRVENAPLICRSVRTCSGYPQKYGSSKLPCPVYSYDTEGKPCPDLLKKAKDEGWELHAPWVEKTTCKLPQHIERWLKKTSFLRSIKDEIRPSVAKQLKLSNCELDGPHMKTLLNLGYVVPMEDDENDVWFVGNVFLHPEEDKRRLRLIYHPKLFNEAVRNHKYQTVELPRLRRILDAASSSEVTIKLDLKCAFFQVPIEAGIFCFRYEGRTYSLTRLPMGASISVLIAQTFSTLTVKCISQKIQQCNMAAETPRVFLRVRSRKIRIQPQRTFD